MRFRHRAGTARRFLQEGATVALNGRRENKLVETIAGFDAAKSLVHPGDVSDAAYMKRLVGDVVAKLGRLDVFVNNAGFATFGPFEKITTQEWRKLLAVDQSGLPTPSCRHTSAHKAHFCDVANTAGTR